MKIYNNIKLFAMMVAMTAMVGCDNEENNLGGEGDLSFEITSSDFECVSGQEQIVSVPAEGYMYSFMVDATEATSWTVSVEGGAWLTVNPVAKQKGSGEIIIKASENSYNEANRTSLVKITNTANEDVYTYRFKQEYDAEYIRPEYEYYTYLEGNANNTCTVENIGIEGNVTLQTFTDLDALDLPDYNFIYESKCEMISEDCFEDLTFSDNKLTVRFNNRCASLSKSKEYLLPVTFSVDGKDVKRVWIVVKIQKDSSIPDAEELPEIKLTTDMLYLSSWMYSADKERLVDNILGLIPNNPNNQKSHWQSEWHSNKNPNFSATYGVYIDVTLKDDNQLKYLTFNYATGADNNNVPCHIKVYAGESKENLVLLGEYKRVENNLPTAVNTWFRTKSELPVFALNNMNVKVVRLSILQSHNAINGTDLEPMTDESRNNPPSATNHPAVTVGEIKLYGK